MFTQVFTQLLVYLYTLTGDLGVAIIAFTLVLRILLLPITLPSMKAGKQMQALQPELKKLKHKYKDKKALQLAQMELYKKYNLNPLAGCLPQIAQIVVLILLYQALNAFLHLTEVNGVPLHTDFLWLNLSQPDPLYILPVLAAVTQLINSLMIVPGGETPDIVPNQSKKKAVQQANEKEEDMAEMAASMQKQMIFMLPFITGFVALQFPSGMALYWVVTTIFSIALQYYVSGPGGLVTYARRAKVWLETSVTGGIK